jgi:hypothetical protein
LSEKTDEFDEALSEVAATVIGPGALTGADAERLEKVVVMLKSGKLNWKANGVPQQVYEVMKKYTALSCGRKRFSDYILERLRANG